MTREGQVCRAVIRDRANSVWSVKERTTGKGEDKNCQNGLRWKERKKEGLISLSLSLSRSQSSLSHSLSLLLSQALLLSLCVYDIPNVECLLQQILVTKVFSRYPSGASALTGVSLHSSPRQFPASLPPQVSPSLAPLPPQRHSSLSLISQRPRP